MKATPLAQRLRAHVAKDRMRGGAPCLTCSLPPELLEAIRAEHKSGTPLAVLGRFLRQEGHPAMDGAIQRHFREHERS